jgi:hypothetical protein
MTEQMSNDVAELPPPPRAATQKSRSRSWAEPTARFLWLSSIALLLVAIYFFAARYVHWRNETSLFDEGQRVNGIVYAPGTERGGIMLRLGDPIEVQFESGGKSHKFAGYLEEPDAQFRSGDAIPLRVDRNNPSKWTTRSQKAGLWARLIGGYMAVVASVGSLLGAWGTSLHYRSLWRNGVLREAVVASHEQFALAPRSVRLRCHITKGRDVLIARVCIPQNQAVPAVGERIQLLCDAESWHQAIPVMTYHQRA